MKIKRIFSLVLAIIVAVCCCSFAAGAVTETQIDTTKKGSIEFYKYEMEDLTVLITPGTGEYQQVPQEATPLAGVEFTIYKIADLEGFFTYEGKQLPTAHEAEEMITQDTPSRSAYTDENGYIKFDNLELGIYYVAETFSPSQVRQQAASFVVSVPMTKSDGTQWLYDITVQLKNQTKYADATLSKVDSKTSAPLEGFKFSLEEKLIAKDGSETWSAVGGEYETAENGKLTVSHLATDRAYRFRETQAKDKSYIVDSTVTYDFYVNDDGTITYLNETAENNTLVITNETVSVDKSVSTDKTNWFQDVTQNINKTVYWKISSTVPQVIDKMDVYRITDTLSNYCTYNSLEVYADNELVSDSNYSVEVSNVQNDTEVTVNITNKAALKDKKVCNIILNTTLNENALIGADNPNTAKLAYTNSVNTEETFVKSTGTPEVHTGGYTWLKTNKSDKPLSGAEFKVYCTLEDAKNNENPLKFEKGSDGKYYCSSAENAESTVVSDENGLVSVLGLKYGEDGMTSDEGSTTYYVAETKAPQNYKLLKEPFEISVTAKSHNYVKENNITVINTQKSDFPLTGGQTAVIFAMLGSIIIAVGAVFILKSRKCVVK